MNVTPKMSPAITRTMTTRQSSQHASHGARSPGDAISSRTNAPPSARSATSEAAVHTSSLSYLSNRVYDYLSARSAWEQRVKLARAGQSVHAAALKVRDEPIADESPSPRAGGSF